MPGIVREKIHLASPVVRLRMETDFEKGRDEAEFFYSKDISDVKWRKAGQGHKLYFGMDHFSGCRCGLSIYSTRKIGGSALFRDFVYEY